jgi:hypothetical protein
MRFIRSAATTLTLAGTMAFAATAVLAASAWPAFAQGPVVGVTPSSATPGESVTFTITCDRPTAMSATLFGTTLGLPQRIPMNPTTSSGEFAVTVSLPTGISPGYYSPSIDCSDGTARTASLTVNPATAPVIDVNPSVAAPGAGVTFAIYCGTGATSATLFGTTLGLAEQIPMEASTHAGEFVTTVHLPSSIIPGYYSPSIDCSPNGTSGTASLTVNPAPGPQPTGPPMTGDGATSSVTGGPFTTAGLALLALGGLAVGVGIIRRRRRAGAGS